MPGPGFAGALNINPSVFASERGQARRAKEVGEKESFGPSDLGASLRVSRRAGSSCVEEEEKEGEERSRSLLRIRLVPSRVRARLCDSALLFATQACTAFVYFGAQDNVGG